MRGVCCKNTIVSILSTKLNDNPQVNTVGVFRSKDFALGLSSHAVFGKEQKCEERALSTTC